MLPPDMDEQYCFINVGRAGGKVKFCMLDKSMSWVGDRYHLRAVMTTNRNTAEITIQVLALPKNHSGEPLCDDNLQITTIQQLIWETAYGCMKSKSYHTITHINRNTMDNRIANLTLDKHSRQKDTTPKNNSSDNLYSSCLQQLISSLPWMNIPDVLHLPTVEERLSTQYYDTAANQSPPHSALSNHMWSSLQPSILCNGRAEYAECHYLPCVNLEQKEQEFDCCGACRSVRYCSEECQKLDWVAHSLHCELLQSTNPHSQEQNQNKYIYPVYDPQAKSNTTLYQSLPSTIHEKTTPKSDNENNDDDNMDIDR